VSCAPGLSPPSTALQGELISDGRSADRTHELLQRLAHEPGDELFMACEADTMTLASQLNDEQNRLLEEAVT
jgi:hypothetical protein